jgi:hypothetical protein
MLNLPDAFPDQSGEWSLKRLVLCEPEHDIKQKSRSFSKETVISSIETANTQAQKVAASKG